MTTPPPLTRDDRNANRGTDRGRQMVRDSLTRFGAGRSILVDKNGVAIAGNQTLQAAEEIGLPTRIIQTDGTELIAVQRNDLDLADGGSARALAYADNRASEVGLDWAPDILAADVDGGLELDPFFAAVELEDLLAPEPPPSPHRDTRNHDVVVHPAILLDRVQTFERAIAATGKSIRGEALLEICQVYLRTVGEADGQ